MKRLLDVKAKIWIAEGVELSFADFVEISLVSLLSMEKVDQA
jgi:hypothetical protein